MDKFWTMNKSETEPNSAEVMIYGTIGSSWWDESISAAQFGKDLKALGSDLEEITVRINSTGGSVYDGLAIRSLLRNHKATVNVLVDGIAASIASIIAMGGDTITMARGSNMMIHNPMVSAFGEAKDLRDTADFLDKIRDSLVSVYEDKTGKSKDELIQLLDAETWMSAEEAVEMGFADKVENQFEATASMAGTIAIFNGVSMDVSRYKNIPERLLAMAPPSFATNAIKPLTKPKEEEEIVDLNKIKNDHPDLYQQIINEGKTLGIQQERDRFKAIDEISMPGYEEIIDKAKYETGDGAEIVAVQMVKQDKSLGINHLQNINTDSEPLAAVGGAVLPQKTETEAQELENAAKGLADLVNKKRKGRR